MNYSFDRKIIANYETGHGCLYAWCLNECDECESKYDRDLIPFEYAVYFTCTSLSIDRRIGISTISHEDNRRITTQNTSISGAMKSGLYSDGELMTDDVTYSMFGTGRIIEKFYFSIYEASDYNEENCTVVAIPSYEFENDNFISSTEPDYFGFSVYLPRERFAELIRLIDSKLFDSILIDARSVSGFYSHWSPSASANSIKILTSRHTVEGVFEESFQPKFAGDVGSLDITFRSHYELNVK